MKNGEMSTEKDNIIEYRLKCTKTYAGKIDDKSK